MTQKGCLVKGHENNQISIICMDLECTGVSKTACQQCITDPRYSHGNCKTFLVWSGVKKQYTNLKIQYPEKYDIDTMYEEILRYEEENVKLIADKFQNLCIGIKQKLCQLKDKYRQQVYCTFRILKTNLANLQKQQQSALNFEELQSILRKFKKNQTTIEDLNQIIREKQKQLVSCSQIQQCVFSYKQGKKEASKYVILEENFEKIYETICKNLSQNQFDKIYQRIPMKYKKDQSGKCSRQSDSKKKDNKNQNQQYSYEFKIKKKRKVNELC